MQRRLEKADNEDTIIEDYSDLKVAAMISTEADTAGGLVEGGSAAKASSALSALADTTDESVLAVREDTDLEELMAATQLKATEMGTEKDDGDDLFKIDATAGEDDDDDLFAMMGGGDDDDAIGGGDDMSSIDAYITASSGANGGLFD